VSTDRVAPIGIFDSGVGGLTVARAVLDRLPAERIRYIGDTAHAPYGPRPVEEIRSYAMDVADSLVDSGVKLLVIACNTAASVGVRELAERRYPVPVIEVISPAVRRALAVSQTRHIGVIGTSATIGSGAYRRAFAQAGAVAGTRLGGAGGAAERPGPVTVHQQACPSFVDFVERGITSGRQITGLAQVYLDPLQKRHIDTLVLGCTHYPLLAGVLQRVMGNGVMLVSSADQTAQDVLAALTARDLLAPRPIIAGPAERPAESRHQFLATGDQAAFDRLRHRFLGPEISVAS
jgi:glutamate racemase